MGILWKQTYGKFCLLQDTHNEPRFLGCKDSQEQGARQGGAEAAGGYGLALHHRLGV